MELWLAQGRAPAFANEQEKRAAWMRNRNWLMALHAKRGRRPDGWWRYESPVPRPRDPDDETPLLYELGLLSQDELALLMRGWREQFDKVQDPEWLGHCIGHAKPGDTFATFVDGARGRRLHYKWAGIPRELIKKWTAERRRRTKTIRKLETAAMVT
jgi:hypothetical protein